MDDKVRWGILGTGKIARILATALAESEDGELVSVGSRDGERAAVFASEFGAARSSRYDGVLEDEEVDLVYVATHHPFHRGWAVAAADAQKHVLCEKPMAVTADHAREIVEAARRNDVFLLEAFAYRCHPQTQRLVELLREGAIGEVRVIDAVFGYDAGPAPTNYLMVHELAGGGILDVGCYTTSMSHLIAAAATGKVVAPTVDVAGAAYLGPTGVDHSTAATLTFESGVIARVACSIQANLDSSVRIYGSEGRITVPSPWLPGRIGSEATIVVERWGTEPQVIDIPLVSEVYTVEVDAVNAFVRKGERSTAAMTWDESLENMRTLDRWRAAIGLRYPDDAP
ncbi:MAG TPA: Gfo/Idh/MocA family oxidoreductase [Actinomycetota bacterium]|nr:Gfo/Idh/MocA family oxidoreductase [Actinomycetota bacterium]